MRISQQSQTPTLLETIQSVIDSVLMDVNVCMPAKIVKYDASKQFADVQPQLQKRYETGVLMTLPVIPNVPVKHPRANAGQTYIHLPLKPGDDVTLVFSQRSLDNWKTKGGIVDPADRRRFNLSDAIALVGGSAAPQAFTVDDPDAIEIQNEDGKVQILPDGTVNLGSFDPTHKVALDDKVSARLSAIENKLNTFIAAYDAHTHPANVPPVVSPPVPLETPLIPSPDPIGSSKVKVVT